MESAKDLSSEPAKAFVASKPDGASMERIRGLKVFGGSNGCMSKDTSDEGIV